MYGCKSMKWIRGGVVGVELLGRVEGSEGLGVAVGGRIGGGALRRTGGVKGVGIDARWEV